MNDTMFTLSQEQAQRVVQGHDANLDPVDAGFREKAGSSPARSAPSRRWKTCSPISTPISIPSTTRAGADSGFASRDSASRIRVDASASRHRHAGYRGGIQWLFDVKSGRFEHDGTSPGYTAHAEFTPSENRGIVVLYNRMDDLPGEERFVDRVAENINELMSGKPARSGRPHLRE